MVNKMVNMINKIGILFIGALFISVGSYILSRVNIVTEIKFLGGFMVSLGMLIIFSVLSKKKINKYSKFILNVIIFTIYTFGFLIMGSLSLGEKDNEVLGGILLMIGILFLLFTLSYIYLMRKQNL